VDPHKSSLEPLPERRDKACEFEQICGTEPALTGCQRGDSVFRCEVSPTQWDLALAALLVEETYFLFAAMLFATERFTHDR
jgi:hypothetical protein